MFEDLKYTSVTFKIYVYNLLRLFNQTIVAGPLIVCNENVSFDVNFALAYPFFFRFFRSEVLFFF